VEVPETLVPDLNLDPVDIRIGLPERAAAQEALSAHREARRIDNEEYERRWRACERAGTRDELLESSRTFRRRTRSSRPYPGCRTSQTTMFRST
jgi:hypothetical protein